MHGVFNDSIHNAAAVISGRRLSHTPLGNHACAAAKAHVGYLDVNATIAVRSTVVELSAPICYVVDASDYVRPSAAPAIIQYFNWTERCSRSHPSNASAVVRLCGDRPCDVGAMAVTVICVSSIRTVSTKPTVLRHVQVRVIQVDPGIDDRYNCARDHGTFVNSFCADPHYSGRNDFDRSAACSSGGLCCGSN